MTNAQASIWESKRTDETMAVETTLRQAGFERVDAYRYNSASIRVRVIDSRFRGLSREQRDAMIEPHLDRLAERTQADVTTLLSFAPEEIEANSRNLREVMLNHEFEDPTPSVL